MRFRSLVLAAAFAAASFAADPTGVWKTEFQTPNVVRNFNGNEFTINYAGAVTGDEIKMKMSFGGDRTMDVVAKRQK